MSTNPKRPSQRDDLKRWDNEGGAPRAGHPSDQPPSSPHTAEAALYYFNIRTESGFIEDPEGETYSDLQAARGEALTNARRITADGDRKGEDRRSWCFEIRDRANQPVLTVAFSEALDPKASH